MSTSFSAAFRDPQTGHTRSVVLVIADGALLARVDPGKAPGENAPHTSTADFTPQLENISTAIQRAAEERAEIDRPYVCPEPMCAIVGNGPHVEGCPVGKREDRELGIDEDDPDPSREVRDDDSEGDDE